MGGGGGGLELVTARKPCGDDDEVCQFCLRYNDWLTPPRDSAVLSHRSAAGCHRYDNGDYGWEERRAGLDRVTLAL
jgi:hypothetical protein